VVWTAKTTVEQLDIKKGETYEAKKCPRWFNMLRDETDTKIYVDKIEDKGGGMHYVAQVEDSKGRLPSDYSFDFTNNFKAMEDELKKYQ
jgi:hypothetical protein